MLNYRSSKVKYGPSQGHARNGPSRRCITSIESRVVMRTAAVIIWGLALFVFTCASNSGFWNIGEVPYFRWSLEPNYHDFLKMDFRTSSSYVTQKIGHFSGFAIFAVLLFSKNKRMGKSIILAVLYAILTEFLQLYCGRHSRLYDIAIDTAGIICGMFIFRFLKYGLSNFSTLK